MNIGTTQKIFNVPERTYFDFKFHRMASKLRNPKEKEEEWRAIQ